MAESGLWDLGWGRGPVERNRITQAELEGPRTGRASGRLKPRRVAFDLRVTQKALNRAGDGPALYHLSARMLWSDQELLHRLLAETPVENKAHLTSRQVSGRTWGVAIDAGESPEPRPFALEAPLHDRMSSVAWPGTVGKNDMVLELNYDRRFGDIWLLMRSNEQIGQGVRVGFTDDGVVVEQDRDGLRTQLAKLEWPVEPMPLDATITLHGTHLDMSLNDLPVLRLDSIRPPDDPHGLVAMIVHDRVRGAAGVDAASLVFTPLK
jgi:hypothetical protein